MYEPTNKYLVGKQVLYPELSYEIMGVLFEVQAELGFGLQEKYYQKAIEVMLQEKGISFRSQVPYNIAIKGKTIGRYFLDFLVDEKIILEIKKDNRFSRKNIAQVKGYLYQTHLQLGILANFTSGGVKYRRIINTLDRS